MDVSDLLADTGKIYTEMAISTILVPGLAPTLTLGVPSDPNKDINRILKRSDSYLPELEFDLEELESDEPPSKSMVHASSIPDITLIPANNEP